MESINSSYYSRIEHGILYYYGTAMYYTLPTVRYLLNHPISIDKIIDHLYISDFSSACDIDTLNKYNITHIITIIPGVAAIYPDKFTYLTIDVVDRSYSNIEIYFNDANTFIENAINEGGNVLIHCQKGISRSATIAMAYLIMKKKYTYEDAYIKMKEARCCINPNLGFTQQLKNIKNN